MVTDRLPRTTRARASCSTASRARCTRPRSSTSMLADQGTALDVVLELVVDDDEVVRRLSGRRTCRRCGHVWHLDFDPPATRGHLRPLRRRAVPARRRQRGDHPAPAGGLRRPDRAAGRLLRRPRPARGVDATGPVEDVTERAIDALRRFDELTAPRDVFRKRRPHDPDQDAERDRADARGRPGRRPTPWSCCARPSRPGVTTADLDALAEECIRGDGGDARRSWATTASRRRSAPRSTTRSCTASRARGCCARATRSRSTAARSSTAGTATRRSRCRSARCRAELDRAAAGHRGVDVARASPRPRLGGRLDRHQRTRSRATSRVAGRLRHRRGVRRPRHRHRDAPGPARAQLRPPGPRPEAGRRGWRWRSSR